MIDFENEKPDVDDEELALKKAGESDNDSDDSGSGDGNVSDEDVDLEDGTAVVLFEDDENYFTSEGVIAKSSLKLDNSGDAEPDKGKGDDQKILGKFKNYDELVESYKQLQSKLGENSEAVEKLRQLNPVLPILETMLSDEAFLGMAENYFSDPEMQAEALRKQIGVDNDFVFDLNNALADPKSDDAKVLDKIMKAKSNGHSQSQRQQQQQQQSQTDPKQKADFLKRTGMSDSDYEQMMQKAQSYKLSLDDIHFILNKDEILKEERRKALKDVKQQHANGNKLKSRNSGNGGEAAKKSMEDSFMDFVSQAGKGVFD